MAEVHMVSASDVRQVRTEALDAHINHLVEGFNDEVEAAAKAQPNSAVIVTRILNPGDAEALAALAAARGWSATIDDISAGDGQRRVVIMEPGE